jgi:hypothetical protein
MLTQLSILAVLAVQTPKPLDKIEIVRLLTNPLFAPSEVADVVRRSCIAFRPTERDWADLRNAGASGEVIASVAACTTRRTAAPAVAAAAAVPVAAAAPLTAVALTSEITANAGAPSTARVFVNRGGVPQRRQSVTLRGTTALGLSRDATAMTDDSGIVVFSLPAVAQPGPHRFEIVGASNTSFPGRPTVTLNIRAGEPGRLRVTPDFVSSVESGATILATVTDSLGNPLPKEPVELTTGVGAAVSVPTDSLGRASFVLTPAALPRGGALQLRVRKLAAVEIPVADLAGLSGALTGFVGPATRRARVGAPLTEPVAFRARTVQGTPAAGRVVRFRAVNALVKPDSAVLDSTGSVPLEITVGARAVDVLVFAKIDSVEKLLTLHADPGPIASLVIEYQGKDVTGREVAVRVATPFGMRVTARDFYGNATGVDALTQLLRASRGQMTGRQGELEVLSMDFTDDAVLLSFKANRMGFFEFTVGSGITATVHVKSVLM